MQCKREVPEKKNCTLKWKMRKRQKKTDEKKEKKSKKNHPKPPPYWYHHMRSNKNFGPIHVRPRFPLLQPRQPGLCLCFQ